MKIYDTNMLAKADEKLVDISREVVAKAINRLISLYFV